MEFTDLEEGWEYVNDEKGLIKKIIKEGEGWKRPETNAKVQVHYTGRLVSDGTKFDSSRDRDSPFDFKLGVGNVIKGWDLGVATMKKGEQAVFRIAPQLGYGDKGTGSIPGGAALEFDVELLSWSSKEDITSGKKGILKKQLVKGEGYNKPNDCAKVSVKYSLKVGDSTIENYTDQTFKFIVGEDQVPSFFEKCVTNLVVNEKALFTVAPFYAYGDAGCPEKNIPPGATLKYEIELVEMEREKETWNMDKEEKLAFALRKKEDGNRWFKLGKYEIACKRYDSALSAVKYTTDYEGQAKDQVEELKTSCELNIAAAKMKESDWKEVLTRTNNVLKDYPDNVKALYRKGVALGKTDNWDDAIRILTKAAELDPVDKAIPREIKTLQNKIKVQNQKDKQLFQKMFK